MQCAQARAHVVSAKSSDGMQWARRAHTRICTSLTHMDAQYNALIARNAATHGQRANGSKSGRLMAHCASSALFVTKRYSATDRRLADKAELNDCARAHATR